MRISNLAALLLIGRCSLRTKQPKVLFASAFSATTPSTQQSGTSMFWNARQDCWRPDIRDVEKISWGMPAKKKGTGSRGVPHRLNEDERRSFDQARRQGFLQVTGSAWRSQRSDAPLLNSYRSLMDARGRPAIVLHKLSPNSSGGDHFDVLVVDLSPLRLPEEFGRVETELNQRVLAEFGVENSQTLEADVRTDGEMDSTTKTLLERDADAKLHDTNSGSDEWWENRPIYQLSPYTISWEVTRQKGKQIGKYLAQLFYNVETIKSSKKPQGVKPGKSRRHGGYGIG